MVENILLIPLGIVLYGSGLLLWPLRKYLRRKKAIHGKALKQFFFIQLVAYLVIIICSLFIRLEHFYYWFGIWIEINFLFTLIGVIAWVRDNVYDENFASR